MNLNALLAATALTVMGTLTTAQEAGDLTVGTGLSTFGLNLEGAYQIDSQWRARGALMGGISAEFSESDIEGEVESEFDLGGIALLADYYPMQSGWRISGGVFLSNTELSSTGSIELEDTSTVEGEVNATFANELAPMITTGYELGFGDGWSFNSEIGIIFTGGIDLEVTADDPTAQSEIDDDPDIQDAIDTASDLFAAPYLSIGVSYTF